MARHFGSVKTFPLDLIRTSVEPRSGSAPERAFLPAPGFKNSSEYPFRQGGFGCWLERVSGFGFRVSGLGFRVRRSEPCWRWVWGVVPSPAGLAPTRAGGLVGGRWSGFGLGFRVSGLGFRVRRSEPCWRWVWVFCSIASRAGCYEGRFVPSPAGVAPTGAFCSIASRAGSYEGVLFHRQQGWLLRGAFCSIASRGGS